MSSKLDWKKFEPKFGTWARMLKPFFDSGEMDKIYEVLKTQASMGSKIAPASINTFRAFKETPLEELKCVIICQDPYFKYINDAPIASGVAMDCSITARVQPTLQQFYNGVEKELYNGLNLNYINTYDLSYLSKQGVLLLNAALTVEKDKPGSHASLWKNFTEFLLTQVLAHTGVPILFLGKEANEFRPLVESTNYCFSLSHPASASYAGTTWDTKNTFTSINKILDETNKETIMWLDIDCPF